MALRIPLFENTCKIIVASLNEMKEEDFDDFSFEELKLLQSSLLMKLERISNYLG